MIGRVEQRVDFGDGHPLAGLSHLHDLVAGAHLAWLQDAEIESRPSARGEQRRHARLVHPDAEAIARHARLRDFKQRAADLIPIADAHNIVSQSFNCEVLAELPVDEVGPFQELLPVAVRFDLVDIDRALLPAVPDQISLTISVALQSVDAATARPRILPDRSVHRATLPRNIARESDVYREQSSHVAPRWWVLLMAVGEDALRRRSDPDQGRVESPSDLPRGGSSCHRSARRRYPARM